MKIPTFTPHEVTLQEIDICKQIAEQQYLYCREHECGDCPFFTDDIDASSVPCTILYTYQFCKEQRR